MSICLSFESRLAAGPEVVWQWITSMEGIRKEMAPWMRMSAPNEVGNLAKVSFEPGVAMFRSWIFLFGFLPFDYSDLTLVSLTPKVGFVEQSKMGTMRLWRHERSIEPLENGCMVRDRLTFEPKFAKQVVARIVQMLFSHRHAMLRKHLGVHSSSQHF